MGWTPFPSESDEMRSIFEIQVGEARPDRDDVLKALGVGPDKEPSERIDNLVDEAMETFLDLAHPRGLVESVTVEEFESIYPGQGLNEPKTPLERIYPRATHLALIAVTLGEEVSKRIGELFERNDFAFGYILDGVASEAAETAADRAQERYIGIIESESGLDSETAHLRYSPGYCGWHISGQKKLFERLRPEDIGIELNDSYLMQPLKSISGVVVTGIKDIHFFNNNYPFCSECTTNSCRERLKLILNTE